MAGAGLERGAAKLVEFDADNLPVLVCSRNLDLNGARLEIVSGSEREREGE